MTSRFAGMKNRVPSMVIPAMSSYSVFVASTRGQADSLRGFMIAALIATVIVFLIVMVFH